MYLVCKNVLKLGVGVLVVDVCCYDIFLECLLIINKIGFYVYLCIIVCR